MASNYDKYYSIKALAEDVLDDRGETDHMLMRYIKWALRGYIEVSLDDHQEPITMHIDMDDKRTIVIPDDYVDWAKVAIQIDGKLKTIGVNGNLIQQSNEDECRNPILETDINRMPTGIDFDNYGGYYFLNYDGSNVYSYGGGLNHDNYFKVNEKLRLIEFSSNVNKTRVYLEYISNGVDPSGNTVVHPYMADYVRKYIHYEVEMVSSKKTEASISRRFNDMKNARVILRARYNDLDPTTFTNLTRKYYSLNIKQ